MVVRVCGLALEANRVTKGEPYFLVVSRISESFGTPMGSPREHQMFFKIWQPENVLCIFRNHFDDPFFGVSIWLALPATIGALGVSFFLGCLFFGVSILGCYFLLQSWRVGFWSGWVVVVVRVVSGFARTVATILLHSCGQTWSEVC